MKDRLFSLLPNGKPNSKIILISLGLLLEVITIIGGILFYFGMFHIHDPDRQQFPIRGIDISSHQKQIDWQRLNPAEVNFILIKATEGGDFKDPLFPQNWQNAQQKGVIVGAYHFFTFCKSGQEQAKNYINTVPRSAKALPPVIDLEFSGNCQARPTQVALEKELNDFITVVENFYQKKPVFYVTYEFYDRYLHRKYPTQPIWLSDFYSLGKLPTLSDGKAWSFWQYSERGRVAGISTLVDLNVFQGNKTQFEKLLITNKSPEPSSPSLDLLN